MAVLAPPIPASVFELPPYQPIFTTLTAQSLGNAGDTSDGFERAFNTAASALAAQPSQSAALDRAIADLAGATGAAGAPAGPNLDAPLAAATRSTAAAYSGFTQTLAALNPLPGDAAHLPAVPPAPQVSQFNLSAAAAATSYPTQLGQALGGGGGVPSPILSALGIAKFLGPLGAVLGGFLAGAALPFVILKILGVNLSGPSAAQIAEDRRIDAPVVQAWLTRYAAVLQGRGVLPTLQQFQADYQSVENLLTAAHLEDYQPLVQQVHDLVVEKILGIGGR